MLPRAFSSMSRGAARPSRAAVPATAAFAAAITASFVRNSARCVCLSPRPLDPTGACSSRLRHPARRPISRGDAPLPRRPPVPLLGDIPPPRHPTVRSVTLPPRRHEPMSSACPARLSPSAAPASEQRRRVPVVPRVQGQGQVETAGRAPALGSVVDSDRRDGATRATTAEGRMSRRIGGASGGEAAGAAARSLCLAWQCHWCDASTVLQNRFEPQTNPCYGFGKWSIGLHVPVLKSLLELSG